MLVLACMLGVVSVVTVIIEWLVFSVSLHTRVVSVTTVIIE